MKNEKEKMCAAGQPCPGGCWCGKCVWWKVLKIFLCLAVAMFVFVCGVGAGVKMSYLQNGKGWRMGEFSMMKCAGYDCGKGNFMFRVAGEDGGTSGLQAQSHAIRLFGSVSKVEGNKITILDNSAQEQVVVSQPETIITATGTEVGISAIKAGMNVVCVGALDKDNQMLAKTIRIQ